MRPDVEGSKAHVEAMFAHLNREPETTLPTVPLDKETTDGLKRAGRAVREWTAERDRRIRAAVDAGGSLREVGEAVGLSHTAVKFIAHGRG